MKAKLPDDVLAALERAQRTQGWNNRRDGVHRFHLMNAHGRAPCLLYVVPARRWAYRRWERLVQERQRQGNARATR